MERSTCQFQGVGFGGLPQELDDIAVFHPRRHEGVFQVIHQNPHELQYVLVRQMLRGHDLSTKGLEIVRLARDAENRSKCLTVCFWSMSAWVYRMTLIAIGSPFPFFPIETSPEPPNATGESFCFLTPDFGMVYELGRMWCSPHILRSLRKHFPFVFASNLYLGPNVCYLLVRWVGTLVEGVSNQPLRVFRPLP